MYFDEYVFRTTLYVYFTHDNREMRYMSFQFLCFSLSPAFQSLHFCNTLCLYIHSPVFAVSYLLGQYQCFARNKYGTAITNSVFVRKSELFNFKDEPPQTMDVEEGLPFGISCAAPNGWPKPNVQWMITAEKSLKTINSSRQINFCIDVVAPMIAYYFLCNTDNITILVLHHW